MMILRRSHERGYADHGWLRSFHSFSFAGYQDPRFMGWGNLRVINEDRIAPGTGFGTHGHRDMEIVSVVLSGRLGHQDSLGHGSTIGPGEVQRMSAGHGIRHSERNQASDQETHFLQIWFVPDAPGGDPGYEQRSFDEADKRGRLRLLISPDGAQGSVSIRADARLYGGLFHGADERAGLQLDARRLAYVHLVRGSLTVNGQWLQAGDALLLQQETELSLEQGQQAEVLVFDLASPSGTPGTDPSS
ncbi:MAG: pirin family protein [Betaproteobacteria bacterium]|nr:pirin family protein [Betaproteobacteria bacterium]NBU48982.1 pirin family protein [Betaproteobacteria bacterium]